MVQSPSRIENPSRQRRRENPAVPHDFAVQFCNVPLIVRIRFPGARISNSCIMRILATLLVLCLLLDGTLCVRVPINIPPSVSVGDRNPRLRTAVFALGSFWRAEAVFGCLPGVERTTAGYAGGTKARPEFRSLGDHAEAVQVEYDPKTISFKQLLDIFWSSHDSRQVFGQGPDVGNQYRSIIFTNGTEEARLASVSKEKEQAKSKSSLVTTIIMQLVEFYPAEFEHQKFELRRNPFLLQLVGGMTEEIATSNFGAKLNGYAAELCPPDIQRNIDGKIENIVSKGWPALREF
ncbi:Peptide methionine sulfoxide reductase A5 [Nymphaea thermarum]|nr:Peptide methionine sulfoxide reductase A5 [Nymphaea thermarum]